MSSSGLIGRWGSRREAFVWGLFLIIITHVVKINKVTIPTKKMGTLFGAMKHGNMFSATFLWFWAYVSGFRLWFSVMILKFRAWVLFWWFEAYLDPPRNVKKDRLGNGSHSIEPTLGAQQQHRNSVPPQAGNDKLVWLTHFGHNVP